MERETIKKLVAGMELEEGQLVLINFWGEEEERETLHVFAQEVAAAGASPIEWMQSRKLNGALFAHMKQPFCEKFYQLFDCVDVVIDLMMQSLNHVGEDMPEDKFELYHQHMGMFFGKVMSKEKLIQITMPTKQNAIEAKMEPEEYIKRMNDAFNIDCIELKQQCKARVEELQGKKSVTVTSGKGCKLTLDIENRPWFIDAGHGDLPCGEIYIAPVEGTANGTVYFETLTIESKGSYPSVTVTIRDGRIVTSTCEEMNQFLAEVPENGDVIAELGIGMNPNVKEFCGYSLLDEKMCGSFHIAIGENRMFGGKNASAMHMDFATTGTVE